MGIQWFSLRFCVSNGKIMGTANRILGAVGKCQVKLWPQILPSEVE